MIKMKVSFIIPCHNAHAHLSHSLESIAGQGLEPEEHEILLIDDGSAPKSLTETQKIAQGYPSLKLLYINHRGPGGARNYGIEHAKGDLIWFVDSDDYLVNGCVRPILSKIESSRLEFISFNFHREEIDRPNKAHIFDTLTRLSPILSGLQFLAQFNLGAEVWRGVFSRELLVNNQICFDENRFCGDSVFVAKAVIAASRCAHLDAEAYIYTFNPHSVTNRGSEEHLRKQSGDMLHAAAQLRMLAEVQKACNSPSAAIKRLYVKSEALVFFLLLRMITKRVSCKLADAVYSEASNMKLLPLRHLGSPDYPGLKYRALRLLLSFRRIYLGFHRISLIYFRCTKSLPFNQTRC